MFADGTSRSLQEISEACQIPKASALRLLATLVRDGILSKSANTGHYSPQWLLVPSLIGEEAFLESVEASLRRISARTAETAEFWIPNDSGLILIRRSEPKDREVRVAARIGFVRSWTGEFEASVRIAKAFGEPPPGNGEDFWTYDSPTERVLLSAEEVDAQMKDAKAKGYALDLVLNNNGVRRFAAPVLRSGRLAGVLCIAQYIPPAGSGDVQELIDILLEEGNVLHS